MYNLRLIGGRLEHVNIRVSVAVIGIFAIITIISYFYELSRAGLLTRHSQYHPRFPHLHREAREVTESGPGLGSRHPLHQLGSQIDSIKSQFRLHKKGDENQEINIAVHLGKNDSYARVNNTTIRAYQHKNTQPNFYTKSCLSVDSSLPDACVRNLTTRSRAYYNATQVLVYQQDPGGYFMRDCFNFVARQSGKVVADVPLNSAKREEWEHTGKAKKKSSVSILYGGLSFGVCETLSQPCLYLTFLSHPVTRILTLYDICSRNRSSSYCKVNGLHQSNITLDDFIRSQKSNLFQKLLYNHRHCKLVGQDEICLPDSGTSFALSKEERKAYLEDIVENLERWFGIVGLIDYLRESLNMFQVALGLDFSQCLKSNKFDNYVKIVRDESSDEYFIREYLRVSKNVDYVALKESLENDSEVKQMLHADLVIYAELEEIFKRQMKAFSLHEHLKRVKGIQKENLRAEEKLMAQSHLSRKMSEFELYDVINSGTSVANADVVDNAFNLESRSVEEPVHIPTIRQKRSITKDCENIKFRDRKCHKSHIEMNKVKKILENQVDSQVNSLKSEDKLKHSTISPETEESNNTTRSSTDTSPLLQDSATTQGKPKVSPER